MSDLPVIDFGSPTIFFDSHPEEQESYLYSYWSSLKSSFKIAFTGVVPKFHEPGKLRIIWWTQDGSEGMKDYELHQYALVRDNFDVLLALPEVRRVVVMGYSGQNPYVLGDRGTNPWAEKFGREWKRTKRQERVTAEELAGQRMDASKEGRQGKLVDIDAVIEKSDAMEEEARKRDEERVAHENEGLLSGEMV